MKSTLPNRIQRLLNGGEDSSRPGTIAYSVPCFSCSAREAWRGRGSEPRGSGKHNDPSVREGIWGRSLPPSGLLLRREAGLLLGCSYCREGRLLLRRKAGLLLGCGYCREGRLLLRREAGLLLGCSYCRERRLLLRREAGLLLGCSCCREGCLLLRCDCKVSLLLSGRYPNK